MRCVGVAEIRFIKYFRDEGVWKNTGFHHRKPVGGGGAARMPARAPRRRSGGGGVTCKLHVAAHAACQASQSDSRSLPLPCHHALAALQPQTACQAASLTDLQAAAARALFKPGGARLCTQKCAIPQLDHSLGPRRCVIECSFGIPVSNMLSRSDRVGFSDLLSIAPQ